MPKHTDELRDLFFEILECSSDHTVFVTCEEIAEVMGFSFLPSACAFQSWLAELDGEYLIAVEQGGFYVSHHP